MKKIRVAVLLTAMAGLFTGSCEKDENKLDQITFEELDPGQEGYWNGSDGSGGFESGNAFFPNYFTDWGGGITSWSGFGYSRLTDVTTSGFTNQYSCYAGSGVNNSSLFGIIGAGDTLVFTVPEMVTGFSVANTTYAALSMRDGDQFSKKFGGDGGDDPDYFELVITGIDESGQVTGTYNHALADFRYEDSGQDFIDDGWTSFSLEDLGKVKKLAFGFESSDVGDWGINTPMYACIDNIIGIMAD